MIVYVAGRISGVSDYKTNFEIAAMRLRDSGYTVLNPAVLPSELTWEQAMPICMEMLKVADAIYLQKGWQQSKGAVMEYEYAKEHGKIIQYEEVSDD